MATTRLAVGDGDAGALLAAVLERVEAEEGQPRDVAVGRAERVVDAEHAAHQTLPSHRGRQRRLVDRGRLGQRQRLRRTSTMASPPTRADPPQRQLAGQRAQRLRVARVTLITTRPSPSREGLVGIGNHADPAQRWPTRPASPRGRRRPRHGRFAAAAARPPRPGTGAAAASATRSGAGMRPATSPSTSFWYSEPSSAAAPSPASSTTSPSLPEAGLDGQLGVVQHADDAHHRRRVDRPAEVLVVERHVARDHRQAERLAGQRHALDRLGQLVADLAGLGVAEVEAVRHRGRPRARAGDVAGRLADGAHAAAARIEPRAPAVAVQRDRDRPPRGSQPHHAGVAARPHHRARADQLVVLRGRSSGGWPGSVEPSSVRSAAGEVGHRRELERLVDQPRRPRAARPRSGARRRPASRPGSRPPPRAVVERAQHAAVGDLADHRGVDVPAACRPRAPRPAAPARRSRTSAPATRRS